MTVKRNYRWFQHDPWYTWPLSTLSSLKKPKPEAKGAAAREHQVDMSWERISDLKGRAIDAWDGDSDHALLISDIFQM